MSLSKNKTKTTPKPTIKINQEISTKAHHPVEVGLQLVNLKDTNKIKKKTTKPKPAISHLSNVVNEIISAQNTDTMFLSIFIFQIFSSLQRKIVFQDLYLITRQLYLCTKNVKRHLHT